MGHRQGDFMGILPTGNRVEAPGIVINRISGGKIAEMWANYGAIGMMQKLGVIFLPGQSEETSST